MFIIYNTLIFSGKILIDIDDGKSIYLTYFTYIIFINTILTHFIVYLHITHKTKYRHKSYYKNLYSYHKPALILPLPQFSKPKLEY